MGYELRQATNRSAADGQIMFDSTNYRRKEKQKQVEKNLTRERIGEESREALKPPYYVAMDT